MLICTVGKASNGERKDRKLSFFPPMTLALILFLCVFPLICTSYRHITEFKRTSMYILTAVTVLLWGGSKLLGKSRVVWNGRICIGALYFVCVLLSALFGSYNDSLNGEGKLVVLYGLYRGDSLFVTLCYCLIYFFFSSSEVEVERTIPFLGEAVLIHFLVVLLQLLEINVFHLFPDSFSVMTRKDYVFQGTLGNIDLTAGYLSLIIPLLISPYIVNKGKLQRFSLFCGMTGVMTVLLSRVDTGRIVLLIIMLGLVAVSLLFPDRTERVLMVLAGMLFLFTLDSLIELPWYSSTKQYEFGVFSPGKTTIYIISFIACMVLVKVHQRGHILKPVKLSNLICFIIGGTVVLVILIYLIPFKKNYYVLWQIHEILNGRGRETFGKYRWGVWQHAIQMSGNSILFGTGPDTFHYAFSEFIRKIGEKITYYQKFDFAHNAYVHILVCNGIGAMISYIVLNIMLIIHAFRTKLSYGIAMGLGLICYCAYEFFTFSIFIVSPMAWTIRGLMAGMENISEKRR